MEEDLPSSEAKKEYFLTTKDLLGVPYKSEYWGFGCGRPTKWYKLSHLEAAAVQKYGSQELAKKRARRAKREETQRKKELAAAKAEEELLMKDQKQEQQTRDENTAPNAAVMPSNKKAAAVSSKALKSIRKAIRMGFKPTLTWDYLRSRNSPHGCNAVAQVPRVSQDEFAALIGRPTDTGLKTLVKSGAWYSICVPYSTVMDSDQGLLGSGGRYGCNRDLGIDPESVLTVKYKPSDDTLSVTGYVQHIDTFDLGDN